MVPWRIHLNHHDYVSIVSLNYLIVVMYILLLHWQHIMHINWNGCWFVLKTLFSFKKSKQCRIAYKVYTNILNSLFMYVFNKCDTCTKQQLAREMILRNLDLSLLYAPLSRGICPLFHVWLILSYCLALIRSWMQKKHYEEGNVTNLAIHAYHKGHYYTFVIEQKVVIGDSFLEFHLASWRSRQGKGQLCHPPYIRAFKSLRPGFSEHETGHPHPYAHSR